MEPLKTATVNLGEHEFIICMSNRAVTNIEQNSKTTDSSIERLTKMFYYTAQAGAKYTGKAFPDNYEDFLDLVDYHYEEMMEEFPKALQTLSDKKKPQKKPKESL